MGLGKYHNAPEIDGGVFGLQVMGHNLLGQLRNVMARVALPRQVHLPPFVPWKSLHPSH